MATSNQYVQTCDSRVGGRSRDTLPYSRSYEYLINGLIQAFHALQTAYIQLLQNPFYSPDDHLPLVKNAAVPTSTSQEITNKKFINEVKRIGESWAPGMVAV
jgi:hypothetical protein